ncbi:hypothetical protein IWX49DRAFT_571252 [Phyllosticta citricarpa]|uniref:Secreted protein n=1 Tax=Phyllosticta paracitricarpa TaxID=2016321 RepID=A0ABR1MYP2_9PEZI
MAPSVPFRQLMCRPSGRLSRGCAVLCVAWACMVGSFSSPFPHHVQPDHLPLPWVSLGLRKWCLEKQWTRIPCQPLLPVKTSLSSESPNRFKRGRASPWSDFNPCCSRTLVALCGQRQFQPTRLSAKGTTQEKRFVLFPRGAPPFPPSPPWISGSRSRLATWRLKLFSKSFSLFLPAVPAFNWTEVSLGKAPSSVYITD